MSGGVPADDGAAIVSLLGDIAMWSGNQRLIEKAFALSQQIATPAPPIEGRDADVERVLRRNLGTLETQRRRCQEWGMSHVEIDHAVRDTRAALQALGERPHAD